MRKTLKILLTLLACDAATFVQSQVATGHLLNPVHSDKLREDQAVVYKHEKEIRYFWDSINTAWDYEDSTRIFYNSMAKPVVKINYGTFTQKDTSIYSNLGLLIKEVHYNFSGTNWNTIQVDTFTYNTQQQPQTSEQMYYNGNVNAGGALLIFTYDNDGLLVSFVFKELENGTWVENFRYSYFYNTNNVLEKIVRDTWIPSANTWQKVDSTVNITFDYWAGSPYDCRYATRSTFNDARYGGMDSLFYDSQNNQIKEIHYERQGNNWVRTRIQTDDYLYDSNNSITEHIQLFYLGNASMASFGIKNTYEDFNSFTIPAIGIAENEEEHKLTVYPNPNNGKFTLNGNLSDKAAIEVFTISGKKVFSTTAAELNGSKEITLVNASKGIYFVRLYDAAKVLTERLVIQ